MESQHLETTIQLYHRLEKQLSSFAAIGNTIENILLVISVVTSGGLWLLAAQVLPLTMTWIGAAFSTLSSGLVLYLYSSGVNKKREKAIKLHFEISKFLAEIRGNSSMTEENFWSTYKLLEHEVRTLGFQRD